jgi:hypothetical protein
MIHDRKQFGIGLALMAVFFGGLFFIFTPRFEGGKNALDYLDGVFNSISKASAYYVPASLEKARRLQGTAFAVRLKARSAEQALQLEKVLRSSGATVEVTGTAVALSGDLGRVLVAALEDADLMFQNDGARVSARYGLEERTALYAWHSALGETMKDLTRQERFAEAATIRDAVTKGLEPAYNYYGVKAIPMRHMVGIALVALIGYVVYTVWYGYAILFLFEGWGLKLEH